MSSISPRPAEQSTEHRVSPADLRRHVPDETLDVAGGTQEPGSGRAGYANPRDYSPAPPARLGAVGWARWFWRQLTSMRVSLILLFLLALAAVPGSVFPQRAVNPIAVSDYFRDHPDLAPILDRLSLFNVFAGPWFAAIYLLLFISLVGCVIPRMIQHLLTARARPPAAPRHLDRLPVHRSWSTAATPGQAHAAAREMLRERHFRVADTPAREGPAGESLAAASGAAAQLRPATAAVSAEKGYLRELGNLLFHVALVLLLIAFAMGKLFGYRASVLVVEGQGFANTVTQFDSFNPGRLFDTSSLPPFSLRLDRFIADYDLATAAPTRFVGQVTYKKDPASPAQAREIRVNHPLKAGGTKVFLGARGYAAVVSVRDANGEVVFRQAVPFLTQDVTTMTGQGVIKVPDAARTQLGFQGFLLPTAVVDPVRGPMSVFPALKNPQLFITGWRGDLGLDSGIPQSVYRLETKKMTQLRDEKQPDQPWAVALSPGDSAQLPGGLGSIALDGVRPWVNLDIADDPGLGPALTAAVLALLGLVLSLGIRRRRIWVRATASDGGRTVVQIGALAPTESAVLGTEVDQLAAALRAGLPPAGDADQHGRDDTPDARVRPDDGD
jgi:cytochrome c biogenesis protein